MKQEKKETLIVRASPNCAFDIGIYLWMLEDTRSRTKGSLQGISQLVLDWNGSPGGNCIGSILYHIAAIEMSWLFSEILQSNFPPEIKKLFPYNVRDEKGRLSIVKGVCIEEHVQRLDETRKYFLDSVQGMSIDEFRRIRELEEYDVNCEWVVHHLMQHESEHRGQILEIRRLAEN
ncbi:MAG: DinB family protein [Anaerolineales bacterium]